jgi:hypothetical protein
MSRFLITCGTEDLDVSDSLGVRAQSVVLPLAAYISQHETSSFARAKLQNQVVLKRFTMDVLAGQPNRT